MLDLAQLEREQAYLRSWRPFYHPVATVAEVDAPRLDEKGRQKPFAVELLGERLVIARLNGRLVTMHGTCPHRSAALAVGWINETCDAVVCRYHGFEWGATGRIAAIPALEADGHPLPTGAGWQVKTYPTVEAYGLVWVSLDDNPLFPVIEIPEADDPAFVACPISVQEWKAGCGRMVEAALDNYHFAFTHQDTLGDPSYPNAPRAHTTVKDGYLYVEYEVDQPVNETITSAHSTQTQRYEKVHYQVWARPNAVRLLKTSAVGRYVIVITVCPVAPLRSKFFRLVYRDFDLDVPHSVFYDFEERVNAEDQYVVETMRPWELSTDLDEELQAYMDRPTVTYRKWLSQLGIQYL